MHESKHLTAFAERLSRGAPIEQPWLEEATAVLAEELWSRPIYATAWKGDATYRQTLYCDVRPTFPECRDRPFSMFEAFAWLYDYETTVADRSPFGPTSDRDASFYGSGWSLVRWAIDQYAPAESDFLRALVQDATHAGAANLESRAGRPFAELVSDWSTSLAVDNAAPTRPQLQFPSWNTPDVFAGMCRDFPTFFPSCSPLQRWSASPGASPLPAQQLHGGAAAFVLTGNFATLRIRGPGGTALPPTLRVQVVRTN